MTVTVRGTLIMTSNGKGLSSLSGPEGVYILVDLPGYEGTCSPGGLIDRQSIAQNMI